MFAPRLPPLCCIALSLLFVSLPLAAQVHITVSASKPTYLVGEPVFAIVRVVNVGSDPVAYSDAESQITVVVVGHAQQKSPPIWGCHSPLAGGALVGVDHPPQLQPGQSTAFRYVLRNYQLAAGRYRLRVSGRAGVRWKQAYGMAPYPAKVPQLSRFHEVDAVPGEQFEQTVAFTLKVGSGHALRQAYEAYLTAADSPDPGEAYQARDAISEMAPLFLEKAIARFGENPGTEAIAVKGLGRIRTRGSRADLIRIFEKSRNAQVRIEAVYAVAEMRSPDSLPFLRSFLSGQNAAADDAAREPAILAIGRMGGRKGLIQITALLRSTTPPISQRLRSAAVLALTAGRSRAAVPVLFHLYDEGDDYVKNDVCGALMSLTHRNWCIRAPDQPDYQTPWPGWWRRHAATTVLYGLDDCFTFSRVKPLRY